MMRKQMMKNQKILTLRKIYFNREELRGVSRGKDAKDVDWSKVAASLDDLEQVSDAIRIRRLRDYLFWM